MTRRVLGALVNAVLVGALVVGPVLVAGVPLARALQWGLLAAAGVVALTALARLPVERRPWPDRPQATVVIGWQGLRSVQERLRRRPDDS